MLNASRNLFILMTAATTALSLQAQSPEIRMLAFSSEGRITARSNAVLDTIVHRDAEPPTHVYIMSHGWNNTYEDALDSYRRMLDLMDSVAVRHGLRPTSYRPLVIGIYWPSKAGSDGSRDRSSSEDFHVADARDVLDPARLATADPPLPPSQWNEDVVALNELVSIPEEALTVEDYARMNEIFERYRLIPSDAEGTAGDVFTATAERGSGPSPYDILGLLSFWNKKELAGLVGRHGVGPVLRRLQSRFPDAGFHLSGHSFGAKVVLSALVSDAEIRPVRSVVLIQPAISCVAFNPNGGYDGALAKVSGPIVATYSEHDDALAIPYSAASRLAGQDSERSASPSPYSAMGSVGPDQSRFRSMDLVRDAAADRYMWEAGVPVGVDGSGGFINGHSDFYNAATARMIWSAALFSEFRDSP